MKLKDLDKTVALEIEAKIVEALNDGFPDSSAGQQTWDDKAEAAGNELRKRYPDEPKAQVDAWLDEFCQDYCARPWPYYKAADDKMREAAPDMLEALKAARRDWGALHDMVSDMIERGALTEAMIPDDYMALTSALVGCARTDEQTSDAVKRAGG